jgi:hypothetical protein
MMKDHYDFYRDNFINDQVGLSRCFPEPIRALPGGGQGMAKERYEQ